MSFWFVKIDCHDGTFRFVPFASEGEDVLPIIVMALHEQ